ncbi:MAG: DnaJ C-terminal domain-containing protein [Pirellulaceae bacterium]
MRPRRVDWNVNMAAGKTELNYYELLEVSRDATRIEIQKAYHRQAAKYHPDVNPDPAARSMFLKVQEAYRVLNHPQKREEYDRKFRDPDRFRYEGKRDRKGSGVNENDLDELLRGRSKGSPFHTFDFDQVFGGTENQSKENRSDGQTRRSRSSDQGRRSAEPRQGRSHPVDSSTAPHDLQLEVAVPLKTAVEGGDATIRLPGDHGDTEEIRVRVPEGVEEGQSIRLRGMGRLRSDGQRGDAYLVVRLQPHPFYRREGFDLHAKLPLTISEAVAGATVSLAAPGGSLKVHVPPMTNSGTILRVRGRGVRKPDGRNGDLFLDPYLVLPPKLDSIAVQTIASQQSAYPQSPRQGMFW